MQILSNIGCFDFSKSVVRPKYRTNKRQKLRFGLVARMFSVSHLRLIKISPNHKIAQCWRFDHTCMFRTWPF